MTDNTQTPDLTITHINGVTPPKLQALARRDTPA